jgi:hypothetical protein
MFKTIGHIFGAEIQSGIDNGAYCLRIEDNAFTRALVRESGLYAIHIEPHQDSGRPWFLLPYGAEIDALLTETVDALIDARRNQPNYGQVSMSL